MKMLFRVLIVWLLLLTQAHADGFFGGSGSGSGDLTEVQGTSNEISVASGTGPVPVVSLPATIDLGGKTSFEFPNAAAPTTDAFGECAGDNNAHAASRGALQCFDGTANTWLIGALSSDTPSNGQVPKWNTGGTITWEDDSTGAGGGDAITVDGAAVVDPNFDDAGDINFAYNSPNITATVKADSVALTTDTTGNYVQSVACGNGLTGCSTSEGAALTLVADSASDTVDGIVELATAAETTTGTDATRAVTPDGLAGSDFGKRIFHIEAVADATALTTGDGKAYIPIPAEHNGWVVVGVYAHVGAAVSSSGAPNIDIDICGAVATGIRCSGTNRDLLSTNLTIDANEDGTETAAAAAAINTSNDDLATGEWVRINIDGAGTGTQGLYVEIVIQKP